MPTYNSDMMHCRQEDCKKKKQCYRYWLGQRAVDMVSMYSPTAFDSAAKCELFLNIKDW